MIKTKTIKQIKDIINIFLYMKKKLIINSLDKK